MAISDSTASPFIELHQTYLKCLTTAQNVTTPVGIFFCSENEVFSFEYIVTDTCINMLKVLNWHCDLVCGSVWDLRVVLNSSALVTDIDIISPLQTPRSRASNEGSRRLCKDFTITEKAPTRDLLGAFFVIVKYSFNLRLKLCPLYRAGRCRAAAL